MAKYRIRAHCKSEGISYDADVEGEEKAELYREVMEAFNFEIDVILLKKGGEK